MMAMIFTSLCKWVAGFMMAMIFTFISWFDPRKQNRKKNHILENLLNRTDKCTIKKTFTFNAIYFPE
jgi:hypothetical protein